MSATGQNEAAAGADRRPRLRGLTRLYPLGCVLLAAFAFAFNWATGHRGIFLLDQSQIFDGAWRIVQGQIPYRDVLFPFVPMVFYIQALFFQLFGVSWSSMVLSACVLNTVATLSAMRIVRLWSGSPLLALIAGLFTAVTFQAPFGTLWLEQTALFFDLLALQAVVESQRATEGRRGWWLAGAGFLLSLAMLSKQNFGGLFVPVLAAVIAAQDLADLRRVARSLLWAAGGMGTGLALFTAWLVMFSDPGVFVQRALVGAVEIGGTRTALRLLANLFSFGMMANSAQVDLIGLWAGGAALILAWWNRETASWREMAPAAAAAFLLPIFRTASQASTLNEWQNNCAFVGISASLGASLFFRLVDRLSIGPSAHGATLRFPSARVVKIGFTALAGVWALAAVSDEGRAAWKRVVQQFDTTTVSFRDRLRVRGMEGVYWGEPTLIFGDTALKRAAFEDVAAYLAYRHCNFFVMGDSTLLYGLLRVPSPQPLLYFQAGHAFQEREIPQLDERILAALEHSGIGIVIREKKTFMLQVRDAYPRFPRTWAWFLTHFTHTTDFQLYEVWERTAD